MGNITHIEQEQLTSPNFDGPFLPEVATKASKFLKERGKKTPKSDYYPVSEKIVKQKLSYTDGDISGIVKSEQEKNKKIIGGGYNVGISGNSKTDKLIYAICQFLDRQKRTLNTQQNSEIITRFGDEATINEMQKFYKENIPLVINRVEFAKCYFGKKRIGGKEALQVSQMLFELSQQWYLKIIGEKGKEKIEIVQPIIIPRLPIYESEGSSDFIILLNNDFNIERKFIPLPSTYLQLTQKASHLFHQLFLYLASRAKNTKNKGNTCKVVITETSLWKIIASENKYNRRPKDRKNDFIKAVKGLTVLGLIISYEQGITKSGEPTAEFIVNKDYCQQITQAD